MTPLVAWLGSLLFALGSTVASSDTNDIIVHTGTPTVLPLFSPLREYDKTSWQTADTAELLPTWPQDLNGDTTAAAVTTPPTQRAVLIHRVGESIAIGLDINADRKIQAVEWVFLPTSSADDPFRSVDFVVDGWPLRLAVLADKPDRLLVFRQAVREGVLHLDSREVSIAVASQPNQFDLTRGAWLYVDRDNNRTLELDNLHTAERDLLAGAPIGIAGRLFDVSVTADGATVRFRDTGKRDSAESAMVGSEIPDLPFVDLDGHDRRLSDFRGHWILIHTWGSWCAPCRQEMLDVKALMEAHKPNGLRALGINVGDTLEIARDYASKHELDWMQTAQRRESEMLRLLRLHGTPSYLLINPNGVIVERNLRPKQLNDMVRTERILTPNH